MLASSYPAHAADLAGPFAPHVVRALVERGHRVVVVTQAKPGPRDAGGLDVRWFTWRGGARALAQLRPWQPPDALALASWLRGAARAVADLAERERPDVCLALMALPAGLVTWHIHRRCGIPYVVWALGSDVAVWGRRAVARPLLRVVLRGAAACVADGVRLAAQAEALAGRPCAFLPTLRPLPPAEPALLPAQQRHVVFVGRLERVKGPDVLLHAWARLRRVRRDAVLHVVGEGSLEAALHALADRLGLGGAVVWHGLTGAARVAGLLAAADAVAIPSRSESIPLVLSEALQMRAPLAVTDVGDMGVLVRRHGLGLVAPPEDAAAFARALGGVLAAGRAAYEQRLAAASEAFSVQATVERMETVLVDAAACGCARR
ncbi:MAG: glycosyltransferase [Chloroflexi bacterium]|nr:glycosyltransferase [Chloroflexota bacterium]